MPESAPTPRQEPESSTPAPWLIAAWPGMGNVAIIAAGYLVQQLGLEGVAELSASSHFDVSQVEVSDGRIAPPRLPRSVFFRGKAPPGGRELIVFLGESQPSVGGYAFAHLLLEKAIELGAERVVTFASMASQLHPSSAPKVFGAATTKDTLEELKRLEVVLLKDGQIGGLNGTLLGAAHERGLPGLCLLGEIPFFGAGVPNPKAARAVLSVFAVLSGIDVNLGELDKHGAVVDAALLDLLEQLKAQQAQGGEVPPLPGEPGEGEEQPPAEESDSPSRLDNATRARIESLFDDARADRAKAMRLKNELDRLGVFEQFEDRFLDLFKRGE